MSTQDNTTAPTILVVDDLEDNRDLLTRRLRLRGFEVIEADSGMKALRLLGRNRVSLILLDINMPEMDGFEVLETLRRSLGQHAPPVIMLTALDASEDITRALELGADDYVAKPFDIQVLESRIRNQLRQASKRERLATSAASVLRQAMELKDERTTDSLTGLPTRTQFENHLAELLNRRSGRPARAALLLVDLDGFRAINDAYGRAQGDTALTQVAEFLQARLRNGDYISRIGGDVFAVVLERCTLESARRKTQQLLDDLSCQPLVLEQDEIAVTASAGIVAVEPGGENGAADVDRIMSSLETACRIAKDSGRNQLFVHQQQQEDVVDVKTVGLWAVRLKNAMRENQLLLYGQPIVDTRARHDPAVGRCEVLLRLRDKQDVISPGVFLGAAARHGLAVELDRWVFDNTYACLESLATDWRAQLSRISINLSGQSLASEALLQHIQRRLENGTVPAELICFEITETAAVNDLRLATGFMQALGSMGVSFALDDFGTGVSSFAYLKQLPVDIVKIDGQFASNVHASHIDHAIVSSINRIAHIMGIETVAEYVENESIAAELSSIGIDYLQGYHIGRPIPLQELLTPAASAQGKSA